MTKFLAESAVSGEKVLEDWGRRGAGVNSKALERRGTLQLLRWEERREEKVEVRIRGVGRLRERCSYR